MRFHTKTYQSKAYEKGLLVVVEAGGRRIGQGEIVKIDNQVGVRMVRLFGHG